MTARNVSTHWRQLVREFSVEVAQVGPLLVGWAVATQIAATSETVQLAVTLSPDMILMA